MKTGFTVAFVPTLALGELIVEGLLETFGQEATVEQVSNFQPKVVLLCEPVEAEDELTLAVQFAKGFLYAWKVAQKKEDETETTIRVRNPDQEVSQIDRARLQSIENLYSTERGATEEERQKAQAIVEKYWSASAGKVFGE